MATWDSDYEASPPNTGESHRYGATRIRSVKTEVRERLQNGNHLMDDAPAQTLTGDDGKHYAAASDAFVIYASDGSTELLKVDYDNSVVELPTAGWDVQNPDGEVARWGYEYTAAQWGLPGAVATGNDELPMFIIPKSCTAIQIKVEARGAPSGGSLQVRVDRCPAASDPTSGNFASMGTVTVADGEYSGTLVVDVSLSNGDRLLPYVVGANSAENVTVSVRLRS